MGLSYTRLVTRIISPKESSPASYWSDADIFFPFNAPLGGNRMDQGYTLNRYPVLWCIGEGC